MENSWNSMVQGAQEGYESLYSWKPILIEQANPQLDRIKNIKKYQLRKEMFFVDRLAV